MAIKTYHYYIIKKFINKIFLVSIVFLALIFFLNIFAEIRFLGDYNVEFYFPIMLSAFNTPSFIDFEMPDA